MIRIIPETIEEDLTGILLCSHGSIGKSMIEAVQMIYGEGQNIACLGLEPTDDIDEWGTELCRLAGSFPKGAVVLLDLFGGTPFNQYLMKTAGEALKQNEGQAYAVTGVNLGMVLEAVGQRGSAELERMPEILERAGKDAVINVMDKMKK